MECRDRRLSCVGRGGSGVDTGVGKAGDEIGQVRDMELKGKTVIEIGNLWLTLPFLVGIRLTLG